MSAQNQPQQGLDVRWNPLDKARLLTALRTAPQSLTPSLVEAMRKIGLGFEERIKKKLSGEALGTRTGNLRRSVFSRSNAQGTDAITIVGVGSAKTPYGRIHEQGGSIRPRRGSKLTIPIGEARTGKGVARFSARQLVHAPRAFGYTGAFFRNNVLFGSRNREAVPLFALKSQVAIKSTGYIRGSINEKKSWALDELKKSVTEALRKIFGSQGAPIG